MCSARRAADDLTARARIRDSAVVYFGRHGFQSATVRAIAADAGVSPALVLHHFGSKDGLREACDAYVTDCLDTFTEHASTHLQARDLLDLLSQVPHLAPLVPYTMQAMTEGGRFAERLWERLVQDTEAYLRAATTAGVVRPTADQRSRAEMLTTFKLGMYMLARYVVPAPPAPPAQAPPAPQARPAHPPTTEPAASSPDEATQRDLAPPPGIDIQAIAAKFTIPTLELFTYGMFTSSDYLDAFVEHQRKGTT